MIPHLEMPTPPIPPTCNNFHEFILEVSHERELRCNYCEFAFKRLVRCASCRKRVCKQCYGKELWKKGWNT